MNWSYMQVLGTKPGLPRRAANDLKCKPTLFFVLQKYAFVVMDASFEILVFEVQVVILQRVSLNLEAVD